MVYKKELLVKQVQMLILLDLTQYWPLQLKSQMENSMENYHSSISLGQKEVQMSKKTVNKLELMAQKSINHY